MGNQGSWNSHSAMGFKMASFCKQFDRALKTKVHTSYMVPLSSSVLTQDQWELRVPEALHSYVHSSQGLQTGYKQSISKWVNRLWLSHMIKYYLVVKKEQAIDTLQGSISKHITWWTWSDELPHPAESTCYMTPFTLNSIKWNLIYSGQKASQLLPRNNESECTGKLRSVIKADVIRLVARMWRVVHTWRTQQTDTSIMHNLPWAEKQLWSQTEGLRQGRQVCHNFWSANPLLPRHSPFMKWYHQPAGLGKIALCLWSICLFSENRCKLSGSIYDRALGFGLQARNNKPRTHACTAQNMPGHLQPHGGTAAHRPGPRISSAWS